jgi:hypothetical protein
LVHVFVLNGHSLARKNTLGIASIDSSEEFAASMKEGGRDNLGGPHYGNPLRYGAPHSAPPQRVVPLVERIDAIGSSAAYESPDR